MDPEDFSPSGQFEADVSGSRAAVQAPATTQAQGPTFAVKLSNNGLPIGWLGRDSSGWAVISDNPLNLEQYVHDGKTYFRIPGESNYMSISNNAYVGFYGWSGATVFHKEGEYLVSDHNGQKLSMYSTDNGYLYCWDKYTVLEVEFVTR